ncbi:hypothetical protein R1flu_023197 [Riccia fluitans]|uniref:Uncharacterized protein n=1 Tax=Riccia fluitans TaxID=41844 RepID=A0ABD1XRD8_9MARC
MRGDPVECERSVASRGPTFDHPISPELSPSLTRSSGQIDKEVILPQGNFPSIRCPQCAAALGAALVIPHATYLWIRRVDSRVRDLPVHPKVRIEVPGQRGAAGLR